MNSSRLGSGRHSDPCRFVHQHSKRALYDARRIFAGYVCDACEGVRRARFRPEVFSSLYAGDDL